MKLLVCVKQVPDGLGGFRPDAGATGYDPAGHTRKMNPYDEYALEEALRIRESRPEDTVEVVAISAGPAQVTDTIRRAIAMGADRGVWIEDGAALQGDSARIAAALAAHARSAGYDLVLAGTQSEDLARGEVGPMIAALLDWPAATAVVHETLSADGSRVLAERELEGGAREEVELPLPALLTIQSGIHEVRYPTLTHTLRARGAEIERFEPPAERPAEAAGTTVEVFPPARPDRVEMIEGSLEVMAETLVARIHERTGLV